MKKKICSNRAKMTIYRGHPVYVKALTTRPQIYVCRIIRENATMYVTMYVCGV